MSILAAAWNRFSGPLGEVVKVVAPALVGGLCAATMTDTRLAKVVAGLGLATSGLLASSSIPPTMKGRGRWLVANSGVAVAAIGMGLVVSGAATKIFREPCEVSFTLAKAALSQCPASLELTSEVEASFTDKMFCSDWRGVVWPQDLVTRLCSVRYYEQLHNQRVTCELYRDKDDFVKKQLVLLWGIIRKLHAVTMTCEQGGWWQTITQESEAATRAFTGADPVTNWKTAETFYSWAVTSREDLPFQTKWITECALKTVSDLAKNATKDMIT